MISSQVVNGKAKLIKMASVFLDSLQFRTGRWHRKYLFSCSECCYLKKSADCQRAHSSLHENGRMEVRIQRVFDAI